MNRAASGFVEEDPAGKDAEKKKQVRVQVGQHRWAAESGRCTQPYLLRKQRPCKNPPCVGRDCKPLSSSGVFNLRVL